VYVYSSASFTKQSGTIYGLNASGALKNTAYSDNYGHAVYVEDGKKRNATAGLGVILDSSISGAAGGWIDTSSIGSMTYSFLSGGRWTLQNNRTYQSPGIAHGEEARTRVGFISESSDASITIQLDVSSEAGCDFAFIGALDNPAAAYDGGYYARISGTDSVTVTIPVSTAGSHFIDIGYKKDGGTADGSDCAWFQVIETRWLSVVNVQPEGPPVPGEPSLSSSGGSFSSDGTTLSLPVNQANWFSVGGGEYTSRVWYWNGQEIGGENGSSYYWAGSGEPGIHELSVVVTTGTGKKFSTGCRIIVRSN
jgi:hypothetical protein